jgi:NAD(P)-dependent dehydrogenase (short-subunit alcohol dehydrogenase family)
MKDEAKGLAKKVAIVHAAGISRDSVIRKMRAEDWDCVQAVNHRGAFLHSHHSIPLLRQGARGRIVLIGSINGSCGKFGTSLKQEGNSHEALHI